MIKLLDSRETQMPIAAILADLASKLKVALPEARVEHIGSTAVLGALTKGDLDVFVGVPSEIMEDSLNKIIELGFNIKPDTLRTEELVMLVTDQYDYDVAIQLVTNGSKFEDFIRFRDLLNESPELVKEYNEIKTSAQMNTDDEYRANKAKFINRVLELK